MFPKITGMCLWLGSNNDSKMRSFIRLVKKRYVRHSQYLCSIATKTTVFAEIDLWCPSKRWWTIRSCVRSWKFPRSLKWTLSAPRVIRQTSMPSSHLHPAPTRGRSVANAAGVKNQSLKFCDISHYSVQTLMKYHTCTEHSDFSERSWEAHNNLVLS